MTGIGPVELLANDHIFDAIVEVHRERLGSGYHPTELQAAGIELLHALYRLTFVIHAREGASEPPPMTVRRPGQAIAEGAESSRPGVLRRTVADIIASGGALHGS
jgi:hypothetical protein